MKIAVISDIHGNLIHYPSQYWKGLEECEILFICGDILPLQIQHNLEASYEWLITQFKPWTYNLPVEKVYFIAGNHDLWFERKYFDAISIFSEYDKATYLANNTIDHISSQDSKVYSIYGTPYCHQFGHWSFMYSEKTLTKLFEAVPNNLDILITHDAPYGVSDVCLEGWAADGEHKGGQALRDVIINKKPKYCFHGHLHSSNHEEEMLNDTKVFNTSIVDEQYDIKYEPLIIRI